MNSSDDPRAIGLSATRADPARLAAVHATGLLDSEVEEVFDRLTRVAVRILGVPAAFISLVDAHRDFYKSACGFGEPLASARELTGPTFCHYTVLRTQPLVIPDTAADPLYRDVPTVKTLGVAAYVGVPLVVDGQTVGAFCTIDAKPRDWTDDEVAVLVELAASAQREMELRAAVKAAHAAKMVAEERTEAAEAATLAKSAFLSMMSHELRTPLNAIGGYAELIAIGVRGPVTPETVEYLQRIQRASKHLQTLIGDILEFTHLDAGHSAYELENVAVNEVLTEATEMLAPQIAERKLAFRQEDCVAPNGGSTYAVRADRKKLRQILVNLLTNAIKFTPVSGSVTVSAEVHDAALHIHVSDSGRGVPAHEQARIFEPFVQLERSTMTARHQGVGLGLAISRQLARGMDGDLSVDSMPGVGSTFTVTLPAA